MKKLPEEESRFRSIKEGMIDFELGNILQYTQNAKIEGADHLKTSITKMGYSFLSQSGLDFN